MALAALTMCAVVGCQEDPEDTFAKVLTAPELAENGYILLTKNTMDEDVSWAWTRARFAEGTPSYQLYVSYNNAEPALVGTATADCYESMSKVDFKSVADALGAAPNSSFPVKFFVRANDGDKHVDSEPTTVTVYSYGEAVSPVVEAVAPAVVLDENNSGEQITMVTWSDARLEYNEPLTYKVCVSYNNGPLVEVKSGLTETMLTLSADEWNDYCVATGAAENQESQIDFTIFAVSETYPDGVPSEKCSVMVKTYTAAFPDMLYLPGKYASCSWDFDNCATITANSAAKGLYTAILDLTTADGGNAEFKFSPKAAWVGDFGFEDITVTDDKGFAVATSDVQGSSNVKVPSGIYYVECNMKKKTLLLVEVKTVSLIGSVYGNWDKDFDLTYDAQQKRFTGTCSLVPGEYKFRFNHDWTYAIASSGTLDGGNYKFEGEAGTYFIELSVAKTPFSVRILPGTYPESLYVPGNHNGWSFVTKIQGDGTGIYEGAVTLDGGWKFSPTNAWEGDFAGQFTSNENGHIEGTLGGGGNMPDLNGYYYLHVDYPAMTFTADAITKVGLIGSFNGWGGDEEFTYNAVTGTWELKGVNLAANDEVKVRFNGEWALNRGGEFALGTAAPCNQNGSNIVIPEAGKYNFSLNLGCYPNTITITK